MPHFVYYPRARVIVCDLAIAGGAFHFCHHLAALGTPLREADFLLDVALIAAQPDMSSDADVAHASLSDVRSPVASDRPRDAQLSRLRPFWPNYQAAGLLYAYWHELHAEGGRGCNRNARHMLGYEWTLHPDAEGWRAAFRIYGPAKCHFTPQLDLPLMSLEKLREELVAEDVVELLANF